MQTNLKQKQAKQDQGLSDWIGFSFATLKGKLSDVIERVRTRAKEMINRTAERLANFPLLAPQPVLIPAKATARSRQAVGKKTR